MLKALIISCNDSYDYPTRTRYVEQLLMSRGYIVEHLLSDFDHRSKKEYKADHKSNIHYIHVPHYSKNLSFMRIWSHIRFGKLVKSFVINGDYDLIYHCAPPNYTIKQLSKSKEKKGFRLITEIGDMWPESIPVGGATKRLLKIPFSIWSGYRDKYLNNSDCVIAECDLFKNTIQSQARVRNIQTLYFCKEFAGNGRKKAYDFDQEVVLCYLGSINNIIDVSMIGNLISAIAKTHRVAFHIIGDGEKREELINIAEKSGAMVYFHGILFDEAKKEEIFNQCHYALNIMKPEVFVGMTMKSLDYFSAGIPIINNIGGDVWNLVETEKVGFNINMESIEFVVKDLIDTDKVEYLRMQDNVRLAHMKHFSIRSFNEKMEKILSGRLE